MYFLIVKRFTVYANSASIIDVLTDHTRADFMRLTWPKKGKIVIGYVKPNMDIISILIFS